MEKKFDEVSAKYNQYVNLVNLYNYRRGMNQVKSSLREQLRLYYNHLPLFGLMKHGVTKVLEQEAHNMMFEYAWKNFKIFFRKSVRFGIFKLYLYNEKFFFACTFFLW